MMAFDNMAQMDHRMEPLEKLFQQVEEESERRAQTLSFVSDAAATGRPSTAETALTVSEYDTAATSFLQVTNSTTTTRRRGGSVSVTRFGQLSLADRQGSSQSFTPSVIASKLPGFYQAQLASDSFDSLINDKSDEGVHENYHAEIVDDNVVTQVFRSSTKTSLTKAMGDLIPRRLSRSNSEHGVPNSPREATMIVGIHVEEATVEVTGEDSEVPVRTTVHAPNSIQRRASTNNLLGTATASKATWMSRAKDFTLKIRQRSKTVLSSS